MSWMLLEEVGSGFAAQLARGALEAAGVPCRADTEGPADEFTSAQSLSGRGVGIYVPTERLEDARAILRELRSSPVDELPWDADDEEREHER